MKVRADHTRSQVHKFLCVTLILFMIISTFQSHAERLNPSEFQYRRDITITKNQNSNFNETEDVLLRVDTREVICESIRVTTTDYELVDMYLESECKVENTRIWIRVNTSRTVTENSIVIYMFSNKKSRTGIDVKSKFLIHRGLFFVFQNGYDCGSQWDEVETSWHGKMIRIVNTEADVRITGGSLTHKHNISITTEEYINDMVELKNEDEKPIDILGMHSHYVVFETDAISNFDYERVGKKMCASQGILPSILLNETYFFTLDANEITNNIFVKDSNSINKFFYINEKKVVGEEKSEDDNEEVNNEEANFHTHSSNYPQETTSYKFSSIIINTHDPQKCSSGKIFLAIAKTFHDHEFFVKMENSACIPKHREIGVLMSTEELESTPDEPFIFLTDLIPPIGYTLVSSFDGEFFIANNSLGISSGSESHFHKIKESYIIPGILRESEKVKCYEGSFSAEGLNHNHVFNLEKTEDADHTPPYVNLLFAKRLYNQGITVDYSNNEHMCFGIPFSDEESCFEGRGICVEFDTCNCSNYYYDEQTNCTKFKCDGIDSERRVCNEHGNCTTNNSCECEKGYQGKFCESWTCYGESPTSSQVCSGKGVCVAYDECDCDEDRSGDRCNMNGCYGLTSNDSEVCSGHGVCESGVCDCAENYDASDICSWECAGIKNYDKNVCGGKGDCIDIDKCNCRNGETNLVCGEGLLCFNISAASPKVCSGHGFCVSIDECKCQYGYNKSEKCSWECYGINSENDTVCSGNGECTNIDKCVCNDGYLGSVCDAFKCNELNPSHPNVCSRSGECNSPDNCTCRQLNTHGKDCEIIIKNAKWENSLYDTLVVDYSLPSTDISSDGVIDCNEIIYQDGLKDDISELKCTFEHGYWMTESLNVTGWKNGKGIATINMRVLNTGENVTISIMDNSNINKEIILVLASIFSFLIVVVIILALIITSILFFLYKKKKKIADVVGELGEENLDMILEEVRLEKTNDVAKLRVSKRNYEIDYASLKIIKKIGKGGSNSTVYLCEWNSKSVAYKCFLINNTEDDNVFEEFEKEASILSSISHPSILTFYGCTLKPPRVGIVMEFAKNGDMKNFLINYKNENGKPFKLDGKIKFLCDIASAMEYIHERKILHRDLKSENVLITEHYDAKLMDFGLSKVIQENIEKTARIGTSYYMAPELMKGNDYGPPCDVFSFSMVMFEVLTDNFKPFGKSDFQVEHKISSDPNFRPEMKNVRIKNWLKDIITICWNDIPEERLSFKMIHQIFISEANIEKPQQKPEQKKETLLEKEKKINTLKKIINEKNRLIERLENEVKQMKNKTK